MNNDPTNFSDLLACAAGELDPAAAAELRARLAPGSEQSRLLDLLTRLVASMRADDSSVAPHAAVDRAKAIFTRPPESAFSRWIASVSPTLASLRLDTSTHLTLAGLRGSSDTRHLIFEAPGVEVDLRLAPPRDPGADWSIHAHVDSTAGPVVWAALVHPGTTDIVRELNADSDAEVTLPAAPGTYDILLRIGDSAVRIPGIDPDRNAGRDPEHGP